MKYKDKIKDIKQHKFQVILSSYTPTQFHKVPICHEAGKSGNAHTITVSMNAVPAHLGHGDKMGICGGNGLYDENENYIDNGENDLGDDETIGNDENNDD